MRIAVSADDKNGLESIVSPHFGRCPYFILVDVEDNNVEQVVEVKNPFYGAHGPGKVPGFINEQEADVMLTGGMGARAMQFFSRYGIEPVTGAVGTVRMSLEQYLGGELEGATPCATSQTHGHEAEPAEGEYEKSETERLKEEAESLQEQLAQALRRLGETLGES
ncbi:MAG: NifB/NifX family molybdenum-iron cluster-binding protein [Chloroflexota bacterium]|nr:NifB/NifX family molybdenum-iron cluster-binding protein [Chloroflexota bacterium]